MLSEVLEAFDDSPEGWFIDGTFGLGGPDGQRARRGSGVLDRRH